jgi:hypothetical protein
MTVRIGVWFFGVVYFALCMGFSWMWLMAFVQVYGWSTFWWQLGSLAVCYGALRFCVWQRLKEKTCSLGA